MADRFHHPDDPRPWSHDRPRGAEPERGDRSLSGERRPRPEQAEPAYGRHYADAGRYAGGAPWGGRGDERYPVDSPPPRHQGDWRRERHVEPPRETPHWRGAEPDGGRPPPRRDRDDHPHSPEHRERGFFGRMADEFRGRRDEHGVERRRVEPGRWRDDDDDRPDRFDVEIADEVARRLGRDRRLDSRFIEIAVYHGEVELTGSVLSKEGRRRAKQLAEQVRGVRDVDNHLRVEPWR